MLLARLSRERWGPRLTRGRCTQVKPATDGGGVRERAEFASSVNPMMSLLRCRLAPSHWFLPLASRRLAPDRRGPLYVASSLLRRAGRHTTSMVDADSSEVRVKERWPSTSVRPYHRQLSRWPLIHDRHSRVPRQPYRPALAHCSGYELHGWHTVCASAPVLSA